ncbi:MAG: hypothetical protein KatS3mg015_2905 [Fimbriimonadales bacterium]|nr:MAG: hypothetical protein KatS3mg015_2905 [Fimbriimonadales bacterium]
MYDFTYDYWEEHVRCYLGAFADERNVARMMHLLEAAVLDRLPVDTTWLPAVGEIQPYIPDDIDYLFEDAWDEVTERIDNDPWIDDHVARCYNPAGEERTIVGWIIGGKSYCRDCARLILRVFDRADDDGLPIIAEHAEHAEHAERAESEQHCERCKVQLVERNS